MNEVNEVVDVLAVSEKGRGIIVPIHIKWRNKIYKMREIGLVHRVREGRILHHIFEGTAGGLMLRLDYNTETLQWTLRATSDGLPN